MPSKQVQNGPEMQNIFEIYRHFCYNDCINFGLVCPEGDTDVRTQAQALFYIFAHK